jgi:hypothetical protein
MEYERSGGEYWITGSCGGWFQVVTGYEQIGVHPGNAGMYGVIVNITIV